MTAITKMTKRSQNSFWVRRVSEGQGSRRVRTFKQVLRRWDPSSQKRGSTRVKTVVMVYLLNKTMALLQLKKLKKPRR